MRMPVSKICCGVLTSGFIFGIVIFKQYNFRSEIIIPQLQYQMTAESAIPIVSKYPLVYIRHVRDNVVDANHLVNYIEKLKQNAARYEISAEEKILSLTYISNIVTFIYHLIKHDNIIARLHYCNDQVIAGNQEYDCHKAKILAMLSSQLSGNNNLPNGPQLDDPSGGNNIPPDPEKISQVMFVDDNDNERYDKLDDVQVPHDSKDEDISVNICYNCDKDMTFKSAFVIAALLVAPHERPEVQETVDHESHVDKKINIDDICMHEIDMRNDSTTSDCSQQDCVAKNIASGNIKINSPLDLEKFKVHEAQSPITLTHYIASPTKPDDFFEMLSTIFAPITQMKSIHNLDTIIIDDFEVTIINESLVSCISSNKAKIGEYKKFIFSKDSNGKKTLDFRKNAPKKLDTLSITEQDISSVKAALFQDCDDNNEFIKLAKEEITQFLQKLLNWGKIQDSFPLIKTTEDPIKPHHAFADTNHRPIQHNTNVHQL